MEFDVVIIGAGPAGLSAARRIGRRKSVLVLEKESIAGKKICAGGLTSKALSIQMPRSMYKRVFHSVDLVAPFAKGTVKADRMFVVTIEREELGKYMEHCAKSAGAKILYGHEVVDIEDDHVVVESELGKKKIHYKSLIGADGSASLVRRYLKLPHDKLITAMHFKSPKKARRLQLFFNLSKFGAGYAWIFPHQEYTSVGFGTTEPIETVKPKFLKWAKKQGFPPTELEAAPINYGYKGHEFGNIFLAGDAAGLASGLTGEGIYQAMVSGEDVAKKILYPQYKCVKIAEILKVKKIHENILEQLQKKGLRTRMKIYLFILMVKMKVFNKKLIKLFS